MKKTKLLLVFSLILLTSGIFTFLGCKKDENNSIVSKKELNNVQKQGFKALQWSKDEQYFFSLTARPIKSVARNGKDLIYHPLLIEAYNEIAKQNEKESFIDEIVQKQGVPIWEKSYVYYDGQNRKNLVIIPIAKSGDRKVSSLIVVNKDIQTGGNYFINAMTRENILNTSNGIPKQKLAYTNWMIQYDKILFNTFDENLKLVRCAYASDPASNNPIEPQGGCEWKLMQWCTDVDLQIEWWGGNAPPDHPTYGDHDNDGILNKDDQDWFDLVSQGDHDNDGVPDRLDKDWYNLHLPIGDHDHDGILNKDDPDWKIWFALNGDHDNDGVLNKDDQDWHDFETRFPHWDNYLADLDFSDDFDGYDNFNDWWDNNSGSIEGGDAHFWENMADVFSDIGNWFGGVFGDIGDAFEDLWDWIKDLFDDGPDCPNWGKVKDNQITTSTAHATNRTDVRCEWFYVKTCVGGGVGDNWWTQLVSCTTCTGNTNSAQVEFTKRINDFMTKYFIGNGETSSLLALAQSGCDPFSPPNLFEECLKAKYIQEIATMLNISNAEATKLFNEHQKLIVDNQDYESAYLAAGSPKLGTKEWANVLGNGSQICGTGIVQLNGFSASELQNFRVIPEEDGADLIVPENGVVYKCDGFYYKFQPCDASRHWFKISDSGTVVLTKNSNGSWDSKIDWSTPCKIAAFMLLKDFAVDWQDNQHKHTIPNPFCP